MIAVFAFAGMAFAENRVEVKVTSEPIQFHSLCDKGGGFSLEFDSDSELADGDQITIDLAFGVTLCRGIDLEISFGGDGGFWNNTNVPASDSPVSYVSTGPITGGDGVFFRLFGVDGTQRITLSVMGDSSDDGLTVPAGIDDKLIIEFLTQKTNAEYVTDGIYVAADGDGVYDDMAMVEDNTLCINVSQYDENTVDANMDSLGDKFTFIPSDPQIAHVVSQILYNVVECAKIAQGNVIIGNAGVEQGPSDYCPPFDWDDNERYCDGHSDSNMFVVETSAGGTFYEIADYQVQMTILTDGVYWTNEVVEAEGYATSSDACDDGSPGNDVGDPANYTYLDADDNPASPVDLDTDWSSCTFSEDAVTLITDCDSGVVNSSGIRAVGFDIPAMKYNLDQITIGDEVMVTITLIKCPCGATWSETVNMGRLGCDPPDAPGYSLLYPYATAIAGDGWWDGFVIINPSSSDGEATLYFWESDGDQASMVVAVPANADGGMFVDTLSNMMSAPVGGQIVQAMTQIGGTGVIGDAQCYIVACSDFQGDGFLFMGNWDLAMQKGEAMGYLPRLSGPCP
jgi:hypothetical protein